MKVIKKKKKAQKYMIFAKKHSLQHYRVVHMASLLMEFTTSVYFQWERRSYILLYVCINCEAVVKFLSIFDGGSPMTWGDFIMKVLYFLKAMSPPDGSVDKGEYSANWAVPWVRSLSQAGWRRELTSQSCPPHTGCGGRQGTHAHNNNFIKGKKKKTEAEMT